MASYLSSALKQFQYYKGLADKVIMQLSFNELTKELSPGSNSISILIKHLSGNMLSRWTNFLTEDGEKEWRDRDDEFVDNFSSNEALLEYWEKGWSCLFEAINNLEDKDLERQIYIRNEGHSVTEAINRQLMHYAYHIGQIVFIAKLLKGEDWQSLSIPKGKSMHYNKIKFSQDKDTKHFTDNI